MRSTSRRSVASALACIYLLSFGCASATDGARAGSEPRRSPDSTAAVSPRSASSTFGASVAAAKKIDQSAKRATARGVFVDAAPPQFPVEATTDDDLVVAGVLETVANGSVDTEPGLGPVSRSLVLSVRVQEVTAGEAVVGDLVSARMTVTRNIGAMRSALRPGAPVVMLATPEDTSFDRYLDEPRRGFPAGSPRLRTGGTALAVADGPDSTWFPGLLETVERPASDALPR